MRLTRLCWAMILVCTLAHPAFSAFRPSFSLEYSAWHATNIVLAVATSDDGIFEVVESWKGNLRAGDRLAIPELRPPADSAPISAYPKSRETALSDSSSQLIPKEPPGSRIVLFLTKSGSQAPATSLSQAKIVWKPSDPSTEHASLGRLDLWRTVIRVQANSESGISRSCPVRRD